jgi:hypothetical protein
MNLDKQNHFKLIDAIRSEKLSQEDLDALSSIVSQNGSPQLVDELICNEKAAGRSEEDAVSETMLHVEALADAASFLACILMVHLLPIASCLLMHDVYERSLIKQILPTSN